jgi:hypothetical protein
MKRVVVHIDSLVLRGFQHEDRHAIAAGLQQELTRGFADSTAAQQLIVKGHVLSRNIDSLYISKGVSATDVGVELARGIEMELTK